MKFVLRVKFRTFGFCCAFLPDITLAGFGEGVRQLNTMKIALVILVSLMLVGLLTGCGDGPSNSLAMDDAKVAAMYDLPSKSFELANVVHENGWKEGENYKIKFTYDFVAKANYEGVLASLIGESAEYYKGISSPEKMRLQMVAGMLGGFATGKGIFDVADTKTILDQFSAMPIVVAAIKSNPEFSADKTSLAVSTFIAANVIKSYAISHETVVGTKVSREITLLYMKTEKGWIKTD
jgi:hypothetical protein